jgi:hypothetical protein
VDHSKALGGLITVVINIRATVRKTITGAQFPAPAIIELFCLPDRRLFEEHTFFEQFGGTISRAVVTSPCRAPGACSGSFLTISDWVRKEPVGAAGTARAFLK